MSIPHESKKMPLWIALASICMSIVGIIIGILVEWIIGKPEFEREPIIGTYGWVLTCILGVFLGICYVRKAKYMKWLGIVGIFINFISLLIAIAVFSDFQIINSENLEKRRQERIKTYQKASEALIREHNVRE